MVGMKPGVLQRREGALEQQLLRVYSKAAKKSIESPSPNFLLSLSVNASCLSHLFPDRLSVKSVLRKGVEKRFFGVRINLAVYAV